MQEPQSNMLRHTKKLLQEGKSGEARQLLVAYIKRTPNSAEAWWQLSQTIADEKKQKDCLKRALYFDSAHASARTRLEELEEPPPTQIPDPQPASPFTVPIDNAIEKQDLIEKGPPPSVQVEDHPIKIEEPPSASAPVFADEKKIEEQKTSKATTPKKHPVKKKKKISCGIITLFVILFSLGIVAIGYFGMIIIEERNSIPTPPPLNMPPPATLRGPQSLPPTWTPTPSPTRPATRTPMPSQTPSQTLQPLATFTIPPTEAP